MGDLFIEPLVQYGFVGMSALLLGIVVWLIRRLLSVLDQTNKVISANTEAIHEITTMTRDLLRLNRDLHNKVISRPCIAKREAGV